MRLSHRDATALHEQVLDLVHAYRNEDGSWNAEAVADIVERLDVIRADLTAHQFSR